MTRLKLLLAVGAAGVALSVPATVLADSCANASRPAPACGFDCTSPVIDGNWVWLPSIGVPFPIWGFGPPGTAGAPNTHGNYQNLVKTASGPVEAWLLENSAICKKGIPNRQTSHGIQSGCGE